MIPKATKTQLKNGVNLKIKIRTKRIYMLKSGTLRKRTPLIEIQKTEKH